MRLKPWLVFACVAVGIAAILFGIDLYRHRYVRHNRDVIHLLPPGDLNLIYADIGLIRRAGLLGLLARIEIAPGKEYNDFIRETGFDYTRDLEAVVMASRGNETFLIGRGQFQWERLKRFAVAHQGACEGDACRVAATSADRWVNFVHVQADVLAVAISPNETAADDLRPPGRRLQEQIPETPVWARLSHGFLANPVSLPLPVQILAIDMQSAESVKLWVEPSFLQLKAHFGNGATADTARRQLEMGTRTLTNALAQTKEKPDRATLTGSLMGGSFQVVGSDVVGGWPIYPELLKALQ